MIVQLCGLSGVGKTTLANKVQAELCKNAIHSAIIDGDEYRKTICKDLGFSKADRCENIRRLGIVANEYSLIGHVAIISAINPYEEVRNELKTSYKFVKVVYLDCSLNTLLERDTKGLYRKAFLPDGHPQKIKNLTGVNDHFEVPVNPDLYIHTGLKNIEQSLVELSAFIIQAYYVSQAGPQIPRPLRRPA